MNKKISYAIVLSLLTIFSNFAYSGSREDTIQKNLAIQKSRLSEALEEEKFYLSIVEKAQKVKVEEFKTFKDNENKSRVVMSYFIANHSDTTVASVRSLILLPNDHRYSDHNTTMENIPAGERAFVDKEKIHNQIYLSGYKEPPANVNIGIKTVVMEVKGKRFVIENGSCDELVGVRNKIEKIKRQISNLEQKLSNT